MDEATERALSALNALDPGCDRETWVRILMAAKAAGLNEYHCDDWSMTAPNYGGAKDFRATWRSIGHGDVQEGTLFFLARESGWTDPAKGQRGHRTAAASRPVAKRPTGGSFNASVWWAECIPATVEHPYIARKGGLPDRLRVMPEESVRTIRGVSLAGYLAVPAWSLAGELRTVQFIPPHGGDKLNMPGAKFEDGLFLVGDPAQSPRVLVVEGIGTAWACWKATGHACAVTFGVGRTEAVANALRATWPTCKLMLVPDKGQQAKAAELAKALRTDWVEMPPGVPGNYDAWDYANDHGGDALEALLAAPKAVPMRYRLMRAAEVLQAPRLEWLVRGVLPASGLSAVYGASGSGKTFLTLDLCAAVAEGREWFGRKVKAAPVVYCCLEGEAGLRQRIEAWQEYHGRTFPAGIRFVATSLDLRSTVDRVELAEAAQVTGMTGGLLVVDTLNRAAPGADENASKDMGGVIEGAKELQSMLGGIVLAVHHSGKDSNQGLRGHSSLRAALDAAIEVQCAGGARSWSVDKAKDGADGIGCPFRLESVPVGEHEDGEPITSCVVVEAENAPGLTRKATPRGANQTTAYRVLGDLLKAASWTAAAPPSLPPSRPAVPFDDALAAVAARMGCEQKRQKERAQTALTGLQGNGVVHIEAGWIWDA